MAVAAQFEDSGGGCLRVNPSRTVSYLHPPPEWKAQAIHSEIRVV